MDVILCDVIHVTHCDVMDVTRCDVMDLIRLHVNKSRARRMITWFCLVIIYSLFCTVSAQDGGTNQNCAAMKTCGQCLTAGPTCSWCYQENYALPGSRCSSMEQLLQNGCEQKNIFSKNSSMEFNKNEPPRNSDQSTNAVQLSPQEITVKLRPNEPFKFTVSFKQAENYPVDLYFVMDLSQTMADDKQTLAELSQHLVSEMRNLTKNVRLGFGSFVDKREMPFVSTVPGSLISPCEGCAAPFGFHNILPLTEDSAKFQSEVRKAKISGNLDNLEGGFDAIMQAIACTKEIGWRDDSRKMLLLSSDGGFHYAGDGKLAGIVIPNDGHCHLDSEGYYSQSLYQDYPSISQLSNSIAKHKVNVIFAVTKPQLSDYSKLSGFIDGSTCGELAEDSSNVIDLVKDNYRKISSSIELKSDADESLSVLFRTSCLGNQTTQSKDRARCNEVGLAQNVTFEVSIESKTCPADSKERKKSFNIHPVGLNENLLVHVHLECECDCEKQELQEVNSKKCNSSGTLICGSCFCNEGRFGSYCECDRSSLTDADDKACKRTEAAPVCEGRGECQCGRCACFPVSRVGDQSRRYSGTYCECNNYSCGYVDNQLCGGPERGTCVCGVCACRAGWEGETCQCSQSIESCRASNGKICNDKGTCECGQCVECAEGYKGEHCEDCPLCNDDCETRRPCVECKAYTKDKCDENCTHVELVDEFTVQADQSSWKTCDLSDSAGCYFSFRYHVFNDSYIEALKKKNCPEAVNVLAIILGVIAGVILLGLILLFIWKVCVIIHDRREYARFQTARADAKWDTAENPIYKQATSTYQNPTYGQEAAQEQPFLRKSTS